MRYSEHLEHEHWTQMDASRVNKRAPADRSPDKTERSLPVGLLPRSGVPLYQQLLDILRDAIATDILPVGSTLPTEAQLAERFGVSRITVREALQRLEADGLIRKQKAKNAVVVARHRADPSGWEINSIEDVVAAAAGATLDIQSYRKEAAPEVGPLFGLPAEQSLHCLRSVLRKGRDPYAVSTIYFAPAIGSRLARKHFNDVIVFRVMQRELGIALVDVRMTVSSELADARLARALKRPEGSPILRTRLVYRDDDDQPVEVAITEYPADAFSLTYRLTLRRQR
jgi:GntR family transcriptional regulator